MGYYEGEIQDHKPTNIYETIPYEVMVTMDPNRKAPPLITPNMGKRKLSESKPEPETETQNETVDDIEVFVFKESNVYVMCRGQFFTLLKGEDIFLNYLIDEVEGTNKLITGEITPTMKNCNFTNFKQYLSSKHNKLYREMTHSSETKELLRNYFDESMTIILPKIKLSRNLEYKDDNFYSCVFDYLQANCTVDPKEKISIKSLKEALIHKDIQGVKLNKELLLEYLEIIQSDNCFVMDFGCRFDSKHHGEISKITGFNEIRGLKLIVQ